ncbi:MAG: alkaline phosphatase family protein [Candidatus Hermodarchaeota archaeon]
MAQRGKKLLLIGIDQAIPYLINKFIKENAIPNIIRLCENGVLAEAYSCAPCDTPTNWTTIATGAKTATHGATSFYMHLHGEPLDVGARLRSRTQLSRYCKAEYIWDVAERKNLIPFIINYPSGWPGNVKNGVISLFTWMMPESYQRMVSPSKSYKFDWKPKQDNHKGSEGGNIVKLDLKIKGKKIISPHTQEITLSINNPKEVSLTINGKTQVIKEMEWSNWIKTYINTTNGVLPCLYRIKIVSLNSDTITIKRSAVYNTKGWTNPESFGEELIKNVFEYDFPQAHEVEFMTKEKMSSYLVSARNESLMLFEAIKYAKRSLNWDVCYFHFHPLDTVNHESLAYLHNNSPFYNEEKARNTYNDVKTAYKIVDELVGNLISTYMDKDTFVVFISDHGAIPIWKTVNIPLYLMKSGLTKYNWNHIEKKYDIDWKNSTVFPYMEPPFVWVNLKGRDSHGIVKNSEYEETRDLVIETLYSFKDPNTNERVIELALRKEDADYLGLNGDRIGDVVYFLKPPYGIFDGNLRTLDASSLTESEYNRPDVNTTRSFFGAHAYYLPSTIFGNFSISVPFIISGPGIKKCIKLDDIVNLIDVAPTLSHLLNIPQPKNSEGRILYEIME